MKSPPGTTIVAALVHLLVAFSATVLAAGGGEQPLSKIGVHRATLAIHPGASVDVSPPLLGLQVSFVLPAPRARCARGPELEHFGPI